MNTLASLPAKKYLREKKIKQEKHKACHLLIQVRGDAKVGTGGNYHLATDPLSMACFLCCLHMAHSEVHPRDLWLIDTPEALKYPMDYMIRTHTLPSPVPIPEPVTDAPPAPILLPMSCATPKHQKPTPTSSATLTQKSSTPCTDTKTPYYQPMGHYFNGNTTPAGTRVAYFWEESQPRSQRKKGGELKSGWYNATIVARWLNGENINGSIERGYCDTIDILCDADLDPGGTRSTLIRVRPTGVKEYGIHEGTLYRWNAETKTEILPPLDTKYDPTKTTRTQPTPPANVENQGPNPNLNLQSVHANQNHLPAPSSAPTYKQLSGRCFPPSSARTSPPTRTYTPDASPRNQPMMSTPSGRLL